jgi:hypothetical protein
MMKKLNLRIVPFYVKVYLLHQKQMLVQILYAKEKQKFDINVWYHTQNRIGQMDCERYYDIQHIEFRMVVVVW